MTFNALNGVKLSVGQLTLNGFSISGLATWMTAQELNVCFDMGECPLSAVPMDHVFLTHAHGDHSRCLMRHHALRKMLGLDKEATYYLPERILKATEEWIRASAVFEGVKGHVKLPHLVPLRATPPGSAPLPLTHRKGVGVRAFKADHGVPSLGYTLYETRNKLKPELHGLPGAEIARLKREGVKVEAPLHLPLLTFIGDCTAETLRREDEVWESRVLVIESTFIGEGEERFARERGHTHLSEIGALLREREVGCEAIVLKHFSMRVKPLEALEAALTHIPHEHHERVYLMLDLPHTPQGLSLAELAWRDLV
jgi:ribonuclease Z